ncbi:MAG TPA: hypothetical protein VE944_32085 [Nostoc sp.]|uniref:hypothetical protein n=1 Tax=Nostoc sp. TaxID=1180 RepID=UPI002D6EE799|nr:hypothetical protein [Nostoc sp.]HYX18911.1 hypothetical protein [Nostoc sp.]
MGIFIPRINSELNNPNKDNELSLITEPPRKVITGQIDKDEYGIFGNCYSQSQDFVDLLCEQTSGIFYDINTPEHEIGQWTVDILLCALNVLPKIKAWQTLHNSNADVKWKWDVIIEHEGYLYPVQVKSGLDAIKECKQKFRETLGEAIEKLGDRKESILEKYDKEIDSYMKRNRLTSRKDANIVAKTKKRDQELEQLNNLLGNYKKASPLYIWAARDEDTIKALVRIFAQLFSASSNVSELEGQALKEYKNKYRSIKDILIKEENDKINTIKEVVFSINKYLSLTSSSLEENALMNIDTNKPKRLLDILLLKKAKELLKLAENTLAYYHKSLSIAQDSYDDKIVAQDNKQIIEHYQIKFKEKVLKDIQIRKYRSARRLEQKVTHVIRQAKKHQQDDELDIENIENLVASQEQTLMKNKNIKYIEPQTLIECLDKLIELDSKSSYQNPQLFAEIKNKIIYMASQEVTLKTDKIPEFDDVNSIFAYF